LELNYKEHGVSHANLGDIAMDLEELNASETR
jgi:hypothetical protein